MPWEQAMSLGFPKNNEDCFSWHKAKTKNENKEWSISIEGIHLSNKFPEMRR